MAVLWVPITLLITLSYVAADCPSGWLDCQNGECVALIWQCDGENDCGNNMDEMNCDRPKSKVCTDTEILCVKDESCIPKSWRCDGANDCIDNSDELNCENVDNCNGFRCRDNHCIPRSWKCDGTPDCPDNSDEDSCPSPAAKLCSESEFTCGSGSCLDVKKVCDGRKDCPDGSDEGDHCNDKCTNATCSQKCRSSPHGPECYCNDGYKLNASDKRTCSDIDECSEDGFCSQHCTNILGSYKCSCLDGYDLENNTCKASGPEPVLIFSTLEEIRAMYLRSKRYFPVHKAFVKTASVDADPLNSRVYWVEISNQSSIYSSDIDGSKLETILQTGLMVPEGIAVDYLGRNLYLTDSGLKQILVCKIDGSMCHVLHDTNIHSPRAISLDVYEGLVYWSDWGNQSVGIYRSGMDGSRRVALVSQDIKWPNGIAIDHSTNRLYWTDAFLGTIEYITLDGKTRKVLLKDDTFHPYSLAVFEDNLYWSDWNTFSLDSCNKFSGHKFGVMTREKKHIMGVHVYHPVLARHNRNPCWNHPCSHMCLLAPFNDFACACPFGFKLNADGRRCNIDNGSPMLWVNDETNIYHIRPQSVGSISVDELPLPHMESIGRMAYDWESKALYISDTKKPAIYSVNMTTLARRELVRNHLVMPGDLAYDWLNRNLYWVDSSKGTVEVVSTSTLRRVNVVVDLSKPTAIALLPSAGRMFISTTGDDQSVAMYDMDGKNRKLLIGSSSFVVALAVHPTLSHLYLVDPREEQISFVNYMSPVRNPSILQSRIGSVLSIAADERFVYWTESSKHVLNYAFQDKTFSYTVGLPGHKNGLVSRKVIYASEPPKNSLGHGNCEMNGGCAYLCLGSPNGRTCVCSLGMQLSQDGRTCTEKECTRDEFKCTGSKKCLPHEFVCDGVKDCDDGSDESCTGTGKLSRCPGDDFRCTNGRCIMSTWKCDHRDDCGDGSDEVGCPPPTGCGKDQYQCTDAECIPLLWRCDGENDCNDHSDETACNATSCNPEIQLRCDHGQCIPRSWACDGTNDCFDGTDERNCSSARACDAKQFKCDDGICIDKSLVCDQRSDCDDGSDEKNCTREKCIEGKRQCADGATCIYVHEICDQVKDCPHGDDEVNCTRKESDCLPDQYFCTNNSRCVPKGWLCDGDNDCGDAADENPDNCTRRVKPTLPPHTAFLDCEEFFCGWSGECIPWSKLCDGVNDCKDLTDEGGSCAVSCIEFGCSQVCQRTPQGPKCSCYPGFSLLADEVTCEDLNECSIPGSCSQFCSNTKGGFKCSCAEGYLLEQHSKCKADGGPATLAYLLSDQIRGIDLSTHAQRVYVRREGGTDMRGMDYDAEKGLFFFTDWKEGTIYSYNPNNNKLEALLTVLERPHYLRWDWIAKNLYFTNDEGSIIACTRDGKYCNTLVPEAADHVNGFDIAPRKGVMFWCVWGNGKNRNGIIERADMDGSRRTTIVRERLDWPNAVTVDHIMEMVYWVDARANVMECVNFHGLQRRVVVSDGAYYPYTMAMFEDFVYWSDWGTDIIIRCNKHTGRECKGLHGTNTKSEVFMVVHAVNQPKGENKCHNSECSHLCLPTRTSFSCLCDRNYQMVNGACVLKTTDVMPDTTTPKSFCVPDPCENGALCDEQEDTYICLCPDGYTGDRCDVQQAASTPPYDYSLVVGLVLAILSVVLIVLVAVYCRMKRDKLAQMGESVAVSFRKGVHSKGSRLIVDTDDDGGACERLVLDPHDQPFKKGFRNPLFGKKPKLVVDPESPQPDGDFKRWPSFDSADSAFASGEATREGSQLSVDASPLSGGSVDRLSHFFKR